MCGARGSGVAGRHYLHARGEGNLRQRARGRFDALLLLTHRAERHGSGARGGGVDGRPQLPTRVGSSSNTSHPCVGPSPNTSHLCVGPSPNTSHPCVGPSPNTLHLCVGLYSNTTHLCMIPYPPVSCPLLQHLPPMYEPLPRLCLRLVPFISNGHTCEPFSMLVPGNPAHLGQGSYAP